MITFTRLLARKLRAVFRRALSLSSRGGGPPVVLETGPGGLTVRIQSGAMALEYQEPENVLPAERIVVPYQLLIDCEGTQQTPLTIEKPDKDRIVCQWHEKQVPVLLTYDAHSDAQTTFPPQPAQLLANETDLLAALDDAMETTDTDNGHRYAIDCVELRGASGQITATNGRHLLVQSGFRFPWSDNLLIPRTTFFGAKDLAECMLVHVGKSDDWVTFVARPWTIHLAIQKELRYPRFETVMRDPATATTKLQISPGDAKFFGDKLRDLPCDELDVSQAVTIEANGGLAIRALGPDQPHPTELVLTGSRYIGEPVRIGSDRRFLSRGLRMGFSEICLFGDEGPLQCTSERRTYLWMSLGNEGTIPACDQAIRFASPDGSDSSPLSTQPTSTNGKHPMRRKKPPPEPSGANTAEPTNGKSPHGDSDHAISAPRLSAAEQASAEATAETNVKVQAESAEPAGTAIEQAMALQETLRTVLAQTSGLLKALRREKKQSRLFKSTLASLRELQAGS